MTPWMMAAVICAALPFLHAARGLQTTEWFGGFLPLFIALIIGIAAGVSLTRLQRSWRFSWESLTASSAALSGIIVWGLPIGLMLVVDEFLRSRNWAALVPAAVFWPLAGAAYSPATCPWRIRKSWQKGSGAGGLVRCRHRATVQVDDSPAHTRRPPAGHHRQTPAPGRSTRRRG
jgi:hypothetical protein